MAQCYFAATIALLTFVLMLLFWDFNNNNTMNAIFVTINIPQTSPRSDFGFVMFSFLLNADRRLSLVGGDRNSNLKKKKNISYCPETEKISGCQFWWED